MTDKPFRDGWWLGFFWGIFVGVTITLLVEILF